MGEQAWTGLVCLLAGLVGGVVGAASVWGVGLRSRDGQRPFNAPPQTLDSGAVLLQMQTLLRQHQEATAKAHASMREMLAQWHTQQQHGLAAFAAAQVALQDEFLKSQPVPRAGAMAADVSAPASPSAPRPPSAVIQPSAPVAPPAPSIPKARPPELSSKPVPPAPLVFVAEAPSRELSDAEIDALPPELPATAPMRRRVRPAPKSPVMRRL